MCVSPPNAVKRVFDVRKKAPMKFTLHDSI
jgi:hypothetical protein